MGNSASNANNPPRNNVPPTTSTRTNSISPGPGNPHRSMRSKKRSLELPDLASLSLTPANNAANRGRQTKTASIPIPATPQNPFNHYQLSQEIQPDERSTVNKFDSADFVEDLSHYEPVQHHLHPPSTHQPFPPPRGRMIPTYPVDHRHPSVPRGRQQQIASRQQQLMRIQELYERSQQHPAAPPSSPAGPGVLSMPGDGQQQEEEEENDFVPEMVRSSIPAGLRQAIKEESEEEPPSAKPPTEDLLADPVQVKIVWRGGGKQVLLARAGDDEWKGRQLMERDPYNPNVWSLAVLLQPGTHHVRFWVDDHWRVADDLPAAVDDQGSLSNYVAVPLTYGLPGTPQPFNIIQVPPPPSVQRKPASGPSFWSADSSADGENDDPPPAAKPTTSGKPADTKPKGKAPDTKHATPAAAAAAAYVQAKWTNVLPPELIEAAREEEAYLAASAGQYDSPTGNTRVTGFVPAPNIPPAPGLPRHLEKLILNTRVGQQKGEAAAHSTSGSNAAGGSSRVGSSGIGSGQGGASARRERRERERERERTERERERGTRSSRRGNVPPPPPPSEDGTGDEPPYIPTPPIPGPSAAAAASGITSSSSLPNQEYSTSRSGAAMTSTSAGTLSGGSGGVASAGTTTAATSPQGSLPATPTGPLSPTQTPPQTGFMSGTGPIPSAVLAGTIAPGILLAQSSSSASSATATQGPSTITQLQPYPMDRAPISGSRAITLDDVDVPILTDDNSVLPVPSHVVLHHLCTSAIRNGVLAVANTTRYKKKYLTTVYYKPT